MGAQSLNRIGRLPLEGDNVAIATRDLAEGTRFEHDGREHVIAGHVLEGHRFAVGPIEAGHALLSWNVPFGHALRVIRPGEYVCNAKVLDALGERDLDFPLPRLANFQDRVSDFTLDEAEFRPGRPLEPFPEPVGFDGYERPGGRGSGTRNYIVILGTSSVTASFVRALAARLQPEVRGFKDIAGVVPVAHTEGGGSEVPNNLDLVLRTLAGFMVHPNVGAVLAVDRGTEAVTNEMLERYMRENGYPLDHVRHAFTSLRRDYRASLEDCEARVRGWFGEVGALERTRRPLSELRIALQCGGSDAFSGISGNPLAARVAREVIRHGGAANLAETDELIGAEPYILANTRDLETARAFLDRIATFRERIAWHGHSAEGNPTGGNIFRGLYNITLKSIGAARKKDPEVCLEHVIGYGERMAEPGFYFMDSPGNDLESISGQVAAGCNMIFFITGSGSITNFPFAPTVKFVTTTRRWKLLIEDMDVNAGRYLDGEPMEDLAEETFDQVLGIACGTRSVGERAEHSQVSIWRDWRQRDASRLEAIRSAPGPNGRPIDIAPAEAGEVELHLYPTESGCAAARVALIAPTSLCSGQIALKIADRLNAAAPEGAARFVALPHTEGCGSSRGENEEHYLRTMVGHLLHPYVVEALLLEHGCERTHNDLMRHVLAERGIGADRFGFASVQLDGGIEQVMYKAQRWFDERLGQAAPPVRRAAGLGALSLGLTAVGPVPEPTGRGLARLAGAVTGGGGTVVMPRCASLLDNQAFLNAAGLAEAPAPSLAYGGIPDAPGFHVMDTPSSHAVEALTGLGASGVQVILAHAGGAPLQGHPMIPTLQFATDTEELRHFGRDFDRVIPPGEGAEKTFREVLELTCRTASGTYRPKLWAEGLTDFQVTRGRLGVSL